MLQCRFVVHNGLGLCLISWDHMEGIFGVGRGRWQTSAYCLVGLHIAIAVGISCSVKTQIKGGKAYTHIK